MDQSSLKNQLRNLPYSHGDDLVIGERLGVLVSTSEIGFSIRNTRGRGIRQKIAAFLSVRSQLIEYMVGKLIGTHYICWGEVYARM